MILSGLPDCYHPLIREGLQIFHPYQNSGPYGLLPDGLDIAETSAGGPDFHLEFVRGQTPFLPPEPYGWLDFRMVPRYRMEEALEVVRSLQPGALLAPIPLSGGFLRFRFLGNALEQPDELQQPIPTIGNGLNRLRYSAQISAVTADLLKSALQGDLLALQAIAELEWMGISPRLPVQVTFDPAALLQIFAGLGNERQQIGWQVLVDYIAANWQSLPWEITGTVTKPIPFAEAIADRVRQSFGTFVPAPTPGDGAYFHLSMGASGHLLWDLSEPLAVPRAIQLELHPLTAARQLVAERGGEAVLSETIVPPLPTGYQQIAIAANLPYHLQGILQIGVNLRVEPQLPLRPQAQVKTVELYPPSPLPTAGVRFQAADLAYSYTTYAVVRDKQGVEKLQTPAKISHGTRLYLTLNDFPVHLIPIQADRNLLEIAFLRGILERNQVKETFELTREQPEVALALPQDTNNATLSIVAESRAGLGEVRLDNLPARPWQIGQYSFREFGRQAVTVQCMFVEKRNAVVFEFLAEGEPETQRQALLFAPNQPQQVWHWQARSLFQYHYRYRRFATSTWSDYQSPFVLLTIFV
jgi:hypothetical protein